MRLITEKYGRWPWVCDHISYMYIYQEYSIRTLKALEGGGAMLKGNVAFLSNWGQHPGPGQMNAGVYYTLTCTQTYNVMYMLLCIQSEKANSYLAGLAPVISCSGSVNVHRNVVDLLHHLDTHLNEGNDLREGLQKARDIHCTHT